MADPELPGNDKKAEQERLLEEELAKLRQDDPIYGDDNIFEGAKPDAVRDSGPVADTIATVEPPLEYELDPERDEYGYTGASKNENYNHASSGAHGHISGTIDTAAKDQMDADKKRAERDRDALFTIGYMSFEDYMAKLDELEDALEEVGTKLAALTPEIEGTVGALETRVIEFKELLVENEAQLEALKASGASPEEIAEKIEHIQILKDTIEVYESAGNNLSDEHQQLVVNYADAKAELEAEREKAQEFNNNNKNKGMPQEMQDTLAKLEGKVRDAERELKGIENGLAYGKHLEKLAPGLCDAVRRGDHENICAKGAVIMKLKEFSADGVLSLEEQKVLDAMSQGSGMDNDGQVAEFSNNIAAYGIGMETNEGKVVYGAEAQNYIMEQWETSKQAVEQGIAKTDAELSEAEQAKQAAADALKAEQENVRAIDSDINNALHSGSAKEQREAFLGKVTLGSSGMYSLNIQTVKDLAGNDVYKDHENGTYYRMENGERIDYEDDDFQISTFEMQAYGDYDPETGEALSETLGGIPGIHGYGMSNSYGPPDDIEPPRRFANEQADLEVYNKSWDKHCAKEDIASSEMTLASLESKIKGLEDTKNMQKADIAALDKLKADFESGALNEEDFVAAAGEIANKYDDDGNLASSDSSSESEWEADEKLELGITDYDLAEAEAARNEAMRSIELAARQGGAISQEDYNLLAEQPGMSPEELDKIMEQNKVVIGEAPDTAQPVAAASNQMTFQVIGGIRVPMMSIPDPTASSDPNGVYPGGPAFMGSVLDDYPQYNNGNAEYMRSVDNRVSADMPRASEMASLAFSGASAPEGGMSPEQAAQLRAQQEAELRAQAEELLARNDPQMAGTSGAGSGF